MRSTPSETQTVRTTLPTQRPRMISGVCSECGATYEVEARGGAEAWICPRCGPSTPIDDDDPPQAYRRRRRRFRLPRVRIPFFLVQLLIISITFALFMVLVINYMDSGVGQRNTPQPSIAQASEGANETPANASESSSPSPSGEADVDVAGSTDAVPSVGEVDDQISAEASATGQVTPPQPTGRASAVARLTPRVSLTDDLDSPATNALLSETSLTSQDVELPINVEAKNSMSMRNVTHNMLHFFSRQVDLHVRLVGVYDDATGKVPHRFDVGERKIQLTDADDVNFLRLEVADVDGRSMDGVFVKRTGDLQRKLKWLMPGDWIVISATPGVRYQDESSTADSWGLVLTDITALSQHTHLSGSSGTKKLAERQ